jgi:hypothetical protein
MEEKVYLCTKSKYNENKITYTRFDFAADDSKC